MSDKDDKISSAPKNQEEWTSRHVRLKFQMITASLVASACVAFGIKDVDVFGIINLNKQPPNSLLNVVFYIFAIFSIIGFISRTKFEQRNLAQEHKAYALELYNLVEHLRLTRDETKNIDKESIDKVFSEIPAEEKIQKLEPTKSLRISAAINLVEVHVRKLKYYNSVVIDITNSLKDSEFKFGSTELLKTKLISSVVSALVAIETLEKSSEKLNEMNFIAPKISQKTGKLILQKVYRENIKIESELNNALGIAEKITPEIKGTNRWRRFEIWTLSVIAPTVFSIFVLIFGLICNGERCFPNPIEITEKCEQRHTIEIDDKCELVLKDD